MNRTTLLALVTLSSMVPASDPVTGPAGVYLVTTTGPTRVTSGEGWVRIEWDIEPVVPAPPPPGPVKPIDPPPVVTPDKPVVTTPIPTPPVFTGKVFLLAVYDAAKISAYPPALQAILMPPSKGGSATIGPAMEALGIKWEPYDINDPALVGKAADKSTWRDEALKQKLPCVIAIGQDGQKVTFWTSPFLSDEAAAIELGKKLKGQN